MSAENFAGDHVPRSIYCHAAQHYRCAGHPRCACGCHGLTGADAAAAFALGVDVILLAQDS